MLHHDAAFAGRNVQDVVTVLGHNETSIVFLSPCPRWRHLRRICTTLIFSNSRLDARREMRTEKVKQLVSYIESCSNSGQVLSIGQVAFTTILNILSNTFFSIDMLDLSSNYGREFKELVRMILEEIATPNVADFFPVLKVVDLQGGRRRVKALVQRMFKIFDEIIDMRVKTREEGEIYEDKDVLDSLLTITRKEDNDFGRNEILHFLLDLFAGGADTTSNTIEWAMAELIRKPEKIKIAQAELQEVVGKGKPLEESHITQLSYLNAIVKETLRLHPPTPCLVPRKAETDVELCGYTIPKNSTILINIWAMGRDDKTWENPDLFEPERFLGLTTDYKGHDPELIPFGFGRRMCPGLPLANRSTMLVLGSLIHKFDWRLHDGVIESQLDMSEKFGFTLEKAQPLCAFPILK